MRKKIQEKLVAFAWVSVFVFVILGAYHNNISISPLTEIASASSAPILDPAQQFAATEKQLQKTVETTVKTTDTAVKNGAQEVVKDAKAITEAVVKATTSSTPEPTVASVSALTIASLEQERADYEKEKENKAKIDKALFMGRAKYYYGFADSSVLEAIYDASVEVGGFTPYEILVQAYKESTIDPSCVTGECYGLLQVSKYAVREYNNDHPGSSYTLGDMTELYANTKVGVYYLYTKLLARDGDKHHALMLYNGGPTYYYGLVNSGIHSTEYSRAIINTAEEIASIPVEQIPGLAETLEKIAPKKVYELSANFEKSKTVSSVQDMFGEKHMQGEFLAKKGEKESQVLQTNIQLSLTGEIKNIEKGESEVLKQASADEQKGTALPSDKKTDNSKLPDLQNVIQNNPPSRLFLKKSV